MTLVCLVLASKGLPDLRDIGILLGEQALSGIGTVSVILLYSAFLSGVGDVLGVVMTAIAGQVLTGTVTKVSRRGPMRFTSGR